MEQGLNLIQQLQATPKWGEFEDWYNQYLVDIHSYLVGNLVHLEDIEEDNQKDVYFGSPYGVNFCFLPIEFQKGVFEKFIESRGFEIHFDGNYHLYCNQSYVLVNNKLPNWKSFEELLISYFNN